MTQRGAAREEPAAVPHHGGVAPPPDSGQSTRRFNSHRLRSPGPSTGDLTCVRTRAKKRPPTNDAVSGNRRREQVGKPAERKIISRGVGQHLYTVTGGKTHGRETHLVGEIRVRWAPVRWSRLKGNTCLCERTAHAASSACVPL